MKVSELAVDLQLGRSDMVGDISRVITRGAALSLAIRDQLTFCKTYEMLMSSSVGGCTVVIPRTISSDLLLPNNTYILADNPKLTFMRALAFLHPDTIKPGIDRRTYLHESSYVARTAYIGPFVHIGPRCYINKNVRIHSNVSIYQDSIIEENVLIFPGVTIGGDGFGYERNEENKLERFPHIGGVVIEKDVVIGSNAVIDRGALSNTEIGEGTKIDSLVHVAHNCIIGKHCSIAGVCAFGGSTILGDYSTFATGVVTRNGITIGKNVFVGVGAVVTKDIPDDMTVMGVPAREIEEFKKQLKFMRDNT